MKSQFLVAIALLLLFVSNIAGCSNHSVPVDDKKKVAAVDTLPSKNAKSKYQQEIDDGAPSYSDILEDERNSYKDTAKMDTFFLLGEQDTMFVHFRHYCTFDNKIDVPGKFVKIYGLSKFQTHSFISTLQMRTNAKVIYEGVIKKSDFGPLLDGELREYGALIDPDVEWTGKKLEIDYSISIPLTDIGRGVKITIDTLGNRHTAITL